MATFSYNRELFLICPYNSNHKVAPRRFDIHLVKCARTSSKVLEICPFNVNHRIEKKLFPAHLLECDDNVSYLYERIVKERVDSNDGQSEPQSREVVDLTKRMGVLGICMQPEKLVTTTKSEEPEETLTTNSDWDYDYSWPSFTIKGLDGSKPDMTQPMYGANKFQYQMASKSERKKWNETLIQEALKRRDEEKTKDEQKVIIAKDKEEKVDSEKEKQEMDEHHEKKKQELEQINKESENEKKDSQENTVWIAW